MLFGVVDSLGHRQFREVILVVGRKNGKTLLAAAIQTYIAFDNGEFGSEIYDIAPKLDQADLVFSAFNFNRTHDPALDSISCSRKNDIYIESRNTTVKKIGFNEKKADGYNPMLTIADEMSSWPAERGLKQWEVMTSGTTSREEPITFAISSGGYVNDGPYDELVKRGTAFLLGRSEEERLLPILYMIDDIEKWDDLEELKKSLPGLGISIKEDTIRDQIKIAHGSLSKKAEFITKYCNLKQNSSQAWLDAQDVERCYGKPLNMDDFARHYAVLGIDLSRTTDLTFAILVIEKDGEIYVFGKAWLPIDMLEDAKARDGIPYDIYIKRGFLELAGEGNVDYRACLKWCTDILKEHKIYPLMVGYDRYSAAYLVEDLKAKNFHVDDVNQGENLTPVIREVEGLVKSGRVHFGDNDLLKMHFLDSALKVNSETDRVRLVKLSREKHIDGMAAFLDAMCVRQKWYGELGKRLKNANR